ncbi:MAG: serine/threonine-protein kinase [Nocardioides sp.]
MTDSNGAVDARVVAARYRLEREVGRGGMGAVWLGMDLLLDRPVALKQIGSLPGQDEPDAARVRREARVSAMLNHEHVVAVFDLVESDDQPWLVMEYLDSENLAQRIRREGPATPDQAAALMAQAADALAAAHRAGIVHRDVKPSNMLVTRDGFLKLGDFGIARAKSDVTLTQAGMVTGSPSYLAPEVAAGQGASAASDVWSLGATLYHVVAGQPPYDASENLMGTLYRIVHEEPPRTERAGWLAPLLRATMHRDPQARWTADQVATFLDRGPSAAAGRAESTQVMAAVPLTDTAPRPAVAAPIHTPVEPVAQVSAADLAPDPSGSASGGNRRLPVVLVAVAAMVLAVILGAWLFTRGGDDTPAAGSGTSTKSSSPSASDTPSDSGPTAQGMEEFAGSYLSTVTEDPATTWKDLTPAFQRKSGGFSSYEGFWGTIDSATLVSATGDPDDMTVSYRVKYDLADGSTTTNDVTLKLVYEDGRYLIADEL